MSEKAADVAHINLKLYAQLSRLGWNSDDLRQAVAAYDLVVRLTNGRLRRNGNTFTAHLVGTASLCAAHGGRPDLVLAALLHAAYNVGEFGDRRRGLHEGKRQVIRATIGGPAEEIVEAFTALKWTPESVAALHARAGELDQLEQDVLFLRLVNEVEQRMYLGSKLQAEREDYPEPAAMTLLADVLGPPELAQDLRAVFAEEAAMEPLAVLVRAPNAPVHVAPLSHRPRLLLTFARKIDGVRRRAAQVLTRGGPYGTAFKPSRTRGNPYGTRGGGLR